LIVILDNDFFGGPLDFDALDFADSFDAVDFEGGLDLEGTLDLLDGELVREFTGFDFKDLRFDVLDPLDGFNSAQLFLRAAWALEKFEALKCTFFVLNTFLGLDTVC